MTTDTAIPSAQEVERRLRVALAELGWGDAFMWIGHGADQSNGWPSCQIAGWVPKAVAWTAYSIIYPHSCWSCWLWNSGSIDIDVACREGHCAHPDGPHKPPRELLRAAS